MDDRYQQVINTSARCSSATELKITKKMVKKMS